MQSQTQAFIVVRSSLVSYIHSPRSHLGISLYSPQEYSRVVFEQGSQLKPTWFHRLAKNLTWFHRLTKNLTWFHRLTKNLTWFQRLTKNLTWFQRLTKNLTQRKVR